MSVTVYSSSEKSAEFSEFIFSAIKRLAEERGWAPEITIEPNDEPFDMPDINRVDDAAARQLAEILTAALDDLPSRRRIAPPVLTLHPQGPGQFSDIGDLFVSMTTAPPLDILGGPNGRAAVHAMIEIAREGGITWF